MKKSLVLAALFLLQVLAPTIASAQTNPPVNSGDWTIPVNDVTYFNNSQALVQGDVNVYGTLILQDSSVFLWGANNGDREFTIYSGGTLIVNNSIISAYSSACIDFRANTGTVISFEGSRLDTMCRVLLNSKTMHFNDTTFEKSFVELDLDESTSIFDSSTGQTTYHANLSFQNLIFSNRTSDSNDLWPNDPSRSIDSDGDNVNDPEDAFPNDATQWKDADGDGLGDNANGNNPDPSLDDTDNDGYINQNDPFPTDSTQWEDLDGDGFGDNLTGNNPDQFPNDTDNDGVQNPSDLYPLEATQQTDSDGDGWGDNPFGVDGDQFPNDPTQCCDTDGDGWGDNPNGSMPDAYPLDPSQWMDADRDGLGDNPNGTNPDPYPGDTDNDGVPNNADSFPEDPTKALDTDGDGIADNDENFYLAQIPETNTSIVFTLVLMAAFIAGGAGYFAGIKNQKQFNFSDDEDSEQL